jgi:hypothetical protein
MIAIIQQMEGEEVIHRILSVNNNIKHKTLLCIIISSMIHFCNSSPFDCCICISLQLNECGCGVSFLCL